jgi:hypothetical protein
MPQQREMVQFLDQLGIGNNTASLTFLDSARNSRATLAGAKASQDSATATASEPSQQPAEPVAEIESGVHPGLLISQAPIKPPPQQQQQQQPEEDTLWLLASSAAGGYSADEVQAIQQLLKDGLLEGRSPREVKLLINQYRLAKMILLVRSLVCVRFTNFECKCCSERVSLMYRCAWMRQQHSQATSTCAPVCSMVLTS